MKQLLIKKEDVKPSREDFEVLGVFNPGVTSFEGKTLLLLRVAERPKQNKSGFLKVPVLSHDNKIIIKEFDKNDKNYDYSDPRVIYSKDRNYITSMSHLRIATSTDGVNFDIAKEPTLLPFGKYEEYGIEDSHITYIDNKYLITHSCASSFGILTGLIETKDFVNFERKGYIFHPDNKDVVIFPEKINNKYYALHRPCVSIFGKLAIWIASSDNCVEFGNHTQILDPTGFGFDSYRIGASCVPIKTERGWLEIYHGATENNFYSLGAVLLDINDPRKLIGKTEKPIVTPTENYELKGFFGGVCFSCGALQRSDEVDIYYGAADECVAKTTLKINKILEEIKLCKEY